VIVFLDISSVMFANWKLDNFIIKHVVFANRSQVSSVRKHMKNQLLSLLKVPSSAEKYLMNISTLLNDLGASREEILRVMPR